MTQKSDYVWMDPHWNEFDQKFCERREDVIIGEGIIGTFIVKFMKLLKSVRSKVNTHHLLSFDGEKNGCGG